MCVKLTPLSHCALKNDDKRVVAVVQGQLINKAQFHTDVMANALVFSKHKAQYFALFYEDAYSFCVSLLALMHSGKKVWIAGNNKNTTANKLTELGCMLLGDWRGHELLVEPDYKGEFKLTPLSSKNSQIMIFTSGSSGEAKIISKSLNQFQSEIDFLEQQWGALLGQAQVLATVSHQHIYGLLFRLLWPLAAGRVFHSQMFLSPEPLLKTAGNIDAYWVASPAQLKRLDEETPWNETARLTTIFSSGGFLPTDAATQIQSSCGHKIIEVYGSSETGGIAWRQSVDDPLWTPFAGVQMTMDKNAACQLYSPYLADDKTFRMDDKIELHSNGQFTLLGRMDRIVKVEEKRLSLDELEQALNKSDWISQSHTLKLADIRDKIATVLILTEKGRQYVEEQGRASLIKNLRKQLMQRFESVVLPRKWMFMQAIPLTVQGKINQLLLNQLFSLDKDRFPQIHLCDLNEDKVELLLRVQPGLIYFPGHFPEQPILPGATQLAWVETLGKIIFNIELPFLRMEVIKFKKIIQPGDLIRMELNWKADKAKLYFDLSSENDSHSSGRMLYGAHG